MSTNCFDEAPEIIKEYLVYMNVVKGKSAATVNEYYFDLRSFFRYLKIRHGLVPKDTEMTEISIEDINLNFIKTVTLNDAYEFLNYMKSARGNGAAARSRKVSSISSYFNYLTNKKMYLSFNPMEELETPKQGKRLPKYLTLEQCYDLLNAVDGPYKERDYCILVLFLNCGMRLSELCSINYNSIQDGKLRIIGKGDKERTIYLNEACLNAIEEYMKVRPNDGLKDKYALFISRQNKRLSPKSVQAMVNKYLDKIGLGGQGYSVHKLRHTAATLMYQYGGVDIRILKDILGHENLGTTEIYTHISESQLEAASNANPLSKIKPNTKQKDGKKE